MDGKRGKEMPYTIVFETRNTQEVSATDATTANQALAIITALQGANEEIKFIRSPQEGDIGVEMVRVLAKEEEEEMPVALANVSRAHER
jgi:hypothetical protein